MNPDEVDRRISRARWIKIALFGGIPLLLVAGLFLWYIGRQTQAQTRLEQELADLQAAGLPVDLQTLNEFHESLTDNRRTDQWLRLFVQLESPGFSRSAENMPILGPGSALDVPLPSQPWPEQQQVEAFLESHAKLLADLQDAASDSVPVWIPADFEAFDFLAGFQGRRSAARLLLLEHHAAVYAGQGDRAAESLRSIFGVADSMSGDPLLVFQLVRIAIHSVAIGALQRSIEQDTLDGDAVADLLERLQGYDDFQSPYRTAIAGERAYALSVIRHPQQIDELGGELPFFLFGPRPHDALATLKFFDRMEQVAQEQDLDAFVSAGKSVMREIEMEHATASWLHRWETALSQMLLPAAASTVDAVARSAMQTRLATLAVGVRLYRHRFGEWPEGLDELSNLGLDPTALLPRGGKPFGYRVEDDAAVLWGFDWYSIGAAAPQEVPAEPPPLDDPNQPNNAILVWRLLP